MEAITSRKGKGEGMIKLQKITFRYPVTQTKLNEIIDFLYKKINNPQDYIQEARDDASHDLSLFKAIGITRKDKRKSDDQS